MREYPQDAHGRYNSLVRRLVSFEDALEHAVAARRLQRIPHSDTVVEHTASVDGKQEQR